MLLYIAVRNAVDVRTEFAHAVVHPDAHAAAVEYATEYTQSETKGVAIAHQQFMPSSNVDVEMVPSAVFGVPETSLQAATPVTSMVFNEDV